MINKKSRIFLTGHNGMVGSSILRVLQKKNFSNIITVDRYKLNLENRSKVFNFLKRKKIDAVIHCAAYVGGIKANNFFKADFITKNLQIQNNIIIGSFESGIKKLIFLGSSCIYPKECKQPIKEEYFLTGPLEMTNRPYAVAKIAGVEMCRSFNYQYKTDYISLMPSNLFGPNDNYDKESSHFIPALIRKIYEAKKNSEKDITIWGTGEPKREITYVDDVARAVIFLLNKNNLNYLINVGSGYEKKIRDFAKIIAKEIGFKGKIICNNNSRLDGTPRKIVSTKLIRSYGWRPKFDINKSIKLTIKDFVKYKNKYLKS